MIIRLIATLLIGASLLSSVRADHLADVLPAKGKTERQLAGIMLTEKTRLSDITRLYGKPTRHKAWESGNPKVSSQYEYYWIRAGLNLHVQIERWPGLERVSFVEVNAVPRKVGGTGRGLRVGDTLRHLKRLYGSSFKVRDIPKLGIHDVMLQWRSGYSLYANLDRNNRIISLGLSAPE